MDNSNWTLRFARTGKEAFGHDIQFEKDNSPDLIVGFVCVFAAGFLLGMWVFGG